MSPNPDPLAAFHAEMIPSFCQERDGRRLWSAPSPRLILPGSFNPLHAGHLQLAQVAAELLRTDATFELTIVNADKPALTADEVQARLAQFVGRASIWVTRARTFTEKADLFPGAAFVVGADTAQRIVQPRFYGGDAARMAEALDAFRSRQCWFLVAGRVDSAGRFLSLDDLVIPAEQRDLFDSIPESRFRLDLSSTQLRQASAPAVD